MSTAHHCGTAEPITASSLVSVTSPYLERPSTPTAQTALASRIEHTQLQLRVTALEQTLRQRDRQRQALIDQYEQILTEREDTDEDLTLLDRGRRLLSSLRRWR